MENVTFSMHKNIYLEINDQSDPWPTYMGSSLRMQLGFQKYGKCKFSTIIIEVWNELHIV